MPVEPRNTTIDIQRYLDELRGTSTEPSAEMLVRDVLGRAVNRLHWLCELMLRQQHPRLARGPMNLTSDELLGGVVARLIKAMQSVRPENVRQFFALANRHLRWELNDLARRLDSQNRMDELRESQHAGAPPTEASVTLNTVRILNAVEELPEDEREVFTLTRIQGLSHDAAAELLGVADKTVQRRLKRALILLTQALHDFVPASPPSQPRPVVDSA